MVERDIVVWLINDEYPEDEYTTGWCLFLPWLLEEEGCTIACWFGLKQSRRLGCQAASHVATFKKPRVWSALSLWSKNNTINQASFSGWSSLESQDLKLAWDLGNPLQRHDLTVGFVLKAVDCWVPAGVPAGLNQFRMRTSRRSEGADRQTFFAAMKSIEVSRGWFRWSLKLLQQKGVSSWLSSWSWSKISKRPFWFAWNIWNSKRTKKRRKAHLKGSQWQSSYGTLEPKVVDGSWVPDSPCHGFSPCQAEYLHVTPWTPKACAGLRRSLICGCLASAYAGTGGSKAFRPLVFLGQWIWFQSVYPKVALCAHHAYELDILDCLRWSLSPSISSIITC